ncbi:hypothetical protein V5F34_08765 [Xanthobacter autotrophicus]|uniref:hypothetical protein n=1 Tax=Xanthobacter autotrophicus TaxID=280 RepID=UPI003726AF8E
MNHHLGFTNGAPSRDEMAARIERAMAFRVGGDVGAVAAKQTLREIEADFKTPTPPPEPAKAEVVLAPKGWVTVPADDHTSPLCQSALPIAMIHAGMEAYDRAQEDLENYEAGKTIDWDTGMIVVSIFRAMTDGFSTPPTAPAAARSAAEEMRERCAVAAEGVPLHVDPEHYKSRFRVEADSMRRVGRHAGDWDRSEGPYSRGRNDAALAIRALSLPGEEA